MEQDVESNADDYADVKTDQLNNQIQAYIQFSPQTPKTENATRAGALLAQSLTVISGFLKLIKAGAAAVW